MTDEAKAQRIRDAAAAFNAAVDEAFAAGISTNFGTEIWTGSPAKAHVRAVRIERLADWSKDYPGVKL